MRAVAPEEIWKWGWAPVRRKRGATDPARSARKYVFFGRVPPLFGSKSTISRFGERFRDGQYSLVSCLFAVLLLTVLPPCPAICKSGRHVAPVPYGVGTSGWDKITLYKNRNRLYCFSDATFRVRQNRLHTRRMTLSILMQSQHHSENGQNSCEEYTHYIQGGPKK